MDVTNDYQSILSYEFNVFNKRFDSLIDSEAVHDVKYLKLLPKLYSMYISKQRYVVNSEDKLIYRQLLIEGYLCSFLYLI